MICFLESTTEPGKLILLDAMLALYTTMDGCASKLVNRPNKCVSRQKKINSCKVPICNTEHKRGAFVKISRYRFDFGRRADDLAAVT